MLSKLHLPNKLENEEIIKIIRKDVFILFKKLLFFILLILLPLLFFYFIIIPQIQETANLAIIPIIVLLTSAYYLFIWLFFFFSFIDYYLDIWIITNERIIDIRQDGFFSRTISEQKLFRIQDVTSEVHGAFATILNYGDVHIQTAGTKQRFHFNDIPEPEKIRDTIIKLAQRKKQEMQNEYKQEINEL